MHEAADFGEWPGEGEPAWAPQPGISQWLLLPPVLRRADSAAPTGRGSSVIVRSDFAFSWFGPTNRTIVRNGGSCSLVEIVSAEVSSSWGAGRLGRRCRRRCGSRRPWP